MTQLECELKLIRLAERAQEIAKEYDPEINFLLISVNGDGFIRVSGDIFDGNELIEGEVLDAVKFSDGEIRFGVKEAQDEEGVQVSDA